MNPQECSRYIKCSASICPLDDKMEFRTFYEEDPICKIKPKELQGILGKKLEKQYKKYVKTNLDRGATFVPWKEVAKKLCL
ncbi:hypothetical protein LCGC14_0407070 [marine sediment metagenome]|uniref:Uncharacterized protein n=1 Tax=marine sediment metagenome TaxID=412755 RepID=A0A0F9TDA6_9ZZZZ